MIDFDIDPSGEPNGVTRIQFVMTFDKKFREVLGQFFGEDFELEQDALDPNETPRATFEGVFFGKRVTVQKEKDS